MIRKKLAMIAGITLCSSAILVGCGSAESSNRPKISESTSNDKEDNSSENTTDTSSGNDKVENDKVEEDKIVDEDTTEEEKGIDAIAVTCNETVSNDFVEFTFTKLGTTQEIKPSKPDGVYTYMSDQDNETYMYVRGTIKNIGTSKFEFSDNSCCKLIVDDKYEYNAILTAEEDGGSDLSYIYTYLDPFQSTDFYIHASVPDELVNKYSKITFLFGFPEEFKDNPWGNFDECDYIYSITGTK